MVRAAREAACRSANTANTVAPEPDIRASRHPGWVRSAVSASPIGRRHGEGRPFEIVARRPDRRQQRLGIADPASISGMGRAIENVADLKAERLEDGRRRHRHAGVDQHRGQRSDPERRADRLAGTAHHPRARIEADRHVGARRPGRGDHGRMIEGRPFSSASRRRAAAASDEPPPIPAATGRRLTRSKRTEPQVRHAIGEVPGRADHEIVLGRPGRARRRAADRERQLGGLERASACRPRPRKRRGFPGHGSRRRGDARARAG